MMPSTTHSVDAAEPLEMEAVDCPLCAAPDYRAVLTDCDQAFGVPGMFRLVRCCRCRHVYLNPRPTAESLARCYPAGYSQHRPPAVESAQMAAPPPSGWVRRLRWIPGLRAYYRWLTDNQSQVLPHVPHAGRRALELGCATGDFLHRLQAQGYQVTGVELVAAAAHIAQARGFHVYEGDLLGANFPPASFDDAFAWMVLEHLPQPRQTIAEVHRLLRPGGWFCFSVPNYGSIEPAVFGKRWKGYDLPRHLQHFTVSRLRTLLDECGFGDVRVIHQPSFHNWIGSLGAWRCHRRPGSRLGSTLLRWFYDDPPLWVHGVLGPLAHLQAALRQSGRVTIQARTR